MKTNRTIHIPAGVIQDRVPRPLTREEAGGDAQDSDFDRLAESFKRPERKPRPDERPRRSTNGWTAS